jgi:hypothetical protein
MLTLALDMLRRLFALSRRAVRGEESDAQRAASGRAVPGGDLIFRMRAWPSLPEHGRTAAVYRMLSVMSNQPVNRQWLLARCRMAPQQLDALMQHLVAEGAIEVIDPARFAREVS